MTLVELMVSLALGLLIVLVSTGLLLSARAGYLTQDDEAQMNEAGRYALETIARAVRQAGYENWDAVEAPIVTTESMTPNVQGLDSHLLKATDEGLGGAVSNNAVINGSDVLALRFFGSGTGPGGDGSMLNCAGFSVPAPASQGEADEARGWSIFYVKESNGEGALYCKYQGKKKSEGAEANWSAQPIISGVESFQVLYGIDDDGDGVLDRYKRAAELTDAQSWHKVAAVRVALLLRGTHGVRTDATTRTYDLFGSDYSDAFGGLDAGVRFDENAVRPAQRNRLRAVFSTTIQLRNRIAGGA